MDLMIRKIVAVFLLSCFSILSFAQVKTYMTSFVKSPPAIDGIMDETVWDNIEWGGQFTQSRPYDGKEPSQPTFFKIVYDDNNLYIGILARDSVPGLIDRRMTRRDGFDGDRITICIDSYYDKRTAFSFTISAAGVKGDEYVTEDGDNWDANWDPIWYAKTSIQDTGWTAEIQIPYSQIRFGKQQEYTWGLQILRYLFRKQETSQWQHIPQDASGYVNHFGELRGISGIKPQRQVDLLPYLVTKLETAEKEEGNPYRSKGHSESISGGLDGKIGITNDLMLDFTINPDFGQVEADPSEVNLTAFETYYPEKRPFFIESNNIISLPLTGGDSPFSMDNLFYSRRIGRQPRHSPEMKDGEYVDAPDYTTILGAFKITGKTNKGWSIGLMDNLTQQEKAEISNGSETRKVEIEPLTNYFSGRIEKDINKGNTIIGGMFTATNRDIRDSSINYLADAAYSGGVNFTQYWKNRVYMLRVKGIFSNLKGDSTAINAIQESSVHYYQRPDADYITYDPSRNTLSGNGGTVEFAKFGQGHFSFWTWVTWRSPGLDLNDIGYLRYGDVIFQVFWAGYRIWEPFSIFNRMNFNFNQWSGWDFGGRKSFWGSNINANIQFKNYWMFGTGFNRDGNGLDNGAMRGGPSLAYPGYSNYWVGIESDERKKLIFGISYFNNWSEVNKDFSRNFSLDIAYRPLNSLKLTLSPFVNISTTDIQYVTTEQWDQQSRYITSALDQTIVGLVARVDYNLSPDLTLQYYGQPFIATGDYYEFKYIKDPQAEEYFDRYDIFGPEQLVYDENGSVYQADENADGNIDYTFQDPNFNFLQFRSNLVLRWEYIPGSTLYFVWSQDRTNVDNTGEFDFGNNVDQLFSTTPRNIFMLKVSYRIKL
jgi:hypothetical protein